MKEINIAGTVIRKRKEKGITQDELAGYMGVSKASVSKWETGQSYPDITLLPPLAAYFNISIDELMGYEPQMTKEELRKLYAELTAAFASKPFDEVAGRCRNIMKKYFSCFPLLFQMGTLFVNYAKDASLYEEAKEIFIRVKTESGDVELAKQALSMEAACALALGKPEEVIELLDGPTQPQNSNEVLMASAYKMTGKLPEAKRVMQVGVYRSLLTLLGQLPFYMLLCVDEPDRFDEILKRTVGVADIFELESLHPAAGVPLYLYAAQGHLQHGKKEEALHALQKYTALVTGGVYPLRLHGNDFFNQLNSWFEEFPPGTFSPRDEKSVKRGMYDAVAANPAYAALADDIGFKNVVKKLEVLIDG